MMSTTLSEQRHRRLLAALFGTVAQYGAKRNLPFVCLAHTSPAHRAIKLRHPAIGRIKEYIDEHYHESLSLEDLSRVAAISPFHLLRLFREAEGRTPHEYQLDLRIRKAGELIEQGATIVDAALTTGFYDQSHFTNTFRRLTGTTPGRFRRRAGFSKKRRSRRR